MGAIFTTLPVIKKNLLGFYDILSSDDILLFENIVVYDVAAIIAQRYVAGEHKTLNKILDLESVYSKHHADMLHYLHCLKGANKRGDYSQMAILEDKFQISESRAKNTRDNISIFKRVN